MSEVNPLLVAFDEAPFSQIKDEHFKPAFLAALEEARKEIEDITKSEEPPTYANTLEALEFCGQHLDRISSVFFKCSYLLKYFFIMTANDLGSQNARISCTVECHSGYGNTCGHL